MPSLEAAADSAYRSSLIRSSSSVCLAPCDVVDRADQPDRTPGFIADRPPAVRHPTQYPGSVADLVLALQPIGVAPEVATRRIDVQLAKFRFDLVEPGCRSKVAVRETEQLVQPIGHPQLVALSMSQSYIPSEAASITSEALSAYREPDASAPNDPSLPLPESELLVTHAPSSRPHDARPRDTRP